MPVSAQTTALLSELDQPSVCDEAAAVAAVNALVPEITNMTQQAAILIGKLQQANLAEENETVYVSFEEMNQKLNAIRRLANQITDQAWQLQNAWFELNQIKTRVETAVSALEE